MEPTVSKLRTTSPASSLFQILKDHSCDTVRHLVTTSNTYCYQHAVLELENEGNRLESTSHSFSSKPCRIVVVNESEMLQKMTKAFERLQSDGLVADLVAIPNPEEVILPTNESDLTKTIRDIDRIMQLCDHALYRGHVYARPNLAIFTFSHMMDVDSYLHHLLSNDSVRERVLKHFTVLSKTLGHNDCTIIQQIQFDNDLIEVLDGVVLKISSRRFISCPIAEESRRKISPRIFVPYDSTVIPHAGYFKEGILNSFPDLEERINFLNKFYQCLVVGKMPQKVRKLVVVGPRDSGKTSWSAIFHRIIPAQRIATITKENQFSAAMMDEFTQIVLIDEWSGWCMESSLAKTLLQGGWMTTAVKHKQPRCFFNTCPFYITANELPDFGAEQENVIRRLAVYHTNSLPEVTLGADKWIHDNAMACVAWIVNEINSNLAEVELHERWYEDEQTEAITNTSSRESCQYIATISSEDLHPVPSENASHPPPAIHSSFYKEAEKAAREQARRSMRHQALLTSSSSDESSLFDHPSQGPPTLVSDIVDYNTGNEQDEDVFADQHSASGEEAVHDEQEVVTDQHSPCEEEAVHHEDEDKTKHVNESDARDSDGFYFSSPTPWQINTDMYFRRVAAYIETKFYGQEFKGRPTLAFRTRMENAPRKEKDFLTKADPYIDTWFLIMGKTREAFDLQSFVRAYPNIEGSLAELRRAVGRRVLHEDCPIVKMKESFAMQSDKATTMPPSKSKDNRETTRLNIKRKRLR